MTRHHQSQFLPVTTNHVQQRSIRGDGVQLSESFFNRSSPKKDNDDSSEEKEITEEEEEEEDTKAQLDKEGEDDSSPLVEIISTDDIIDAEKISDSTKKSESTSTTEDSTSNNNKSLLTLLNEVGEKFKTSAQTSTAKGIESKKQSTKILYAAKACLFYTLFISYRTYRGFFVLLPATVRQVYHQMEVVMNTGNLDMIEKNDDNTDTTTTVKENSWRTKITVSLLTSVVTVSYICGGVLKLISKFIRTMLKTSNVTKSFEAAADEMGNFEGRISRVGKKSNNNNEGENIEEPNGTV
ncbi:hypothetical protein FRACYDRAFT_250523 [Fragilariopsis cylindrus CCMP1102]|uniref:Uncharacterized protein n=1 Tax=Fragilariopsis cylindrus CCMP1102 TaxID=635003 RepID=A0A1E7EQ29_9STRA|nr:hypothetical protein FRACYDRAFT_250523 [Fragilariopsis cylindrus CCMP1102]|eukprot:OEU07896.1 hypothetical protein FRACYDRAFT_250523 [Fragilariopsis cylindrus CCMP1102]